MPAAPASGAVIVRPPFAFTGSEVRVRYDDAPAAHLAYAFPTTGHADPDSVSLQVAGSLLGAWTFPNYPTFQSQMLMDVVFDEGGTQATQVSSFHHQYSDTGLFGVYAQTPDEYSVMALSLSLTDGLSRLSHEVEPPALHEAKLHLARALVTELNNAEHQAAEIAAQLLQVGRRIHPLETAARLDAVDAGAVKKAMRRFCWDHCHVLSASGKVYELQDYNWWRRRSFRLRF